MWSDPATEYFGAAYSFDDARAYAHNYAATQQNPRARAQAHVATHPPGAVLWFYGVRRLTETFPALQRGLMGLAPQHDRAKLSPNLSRALRRSERPPRAPLTRPIRRRCQLRRLQRRCCARFCWDYPSWRRCQRFTDWRRWAAAKLPKNVVCWRRVYGY